MVPVTELNLDESAVKQAQSAKKVVVEQQQEKKKNKKRKNKGLKDFMDKDDSQAGFNSYKQD